MRIDDEPGLLSLLLNCIAKYQANILTIHQTIPINGVADITFSIEVLPTTGDVQDMVNHLIETEGVHQVKILARE
jgi:chorismate mutase